MKIGKILPKHSKRIKQLRKSRGYTQNEMTELLCCGDKTYRNWEVYGQNICMELLVKLADFFHVSTDYILGRTDYITIGNEEIHKATGLSEKSIEVLRHLSKEPPSYMNDVATDNYKTIEALNLLLEDVYDAMLDARESEFSVTTLLTWIRDYISSDVEYDVNDYESFVTFRIEGGTQVVDKAPLFAEFTMNRIRAKLDDYRKRYKEQNSK